jgi:hypothetical protein
VSVLHMHVGNLSDIADQELWPAGHLTGPTRISLAVCELLHDCSKFVHRFGHNQWPDRTFVRPT